MNHTPSQSVPPKGQKPNAESQLIPKKKTKDLSKKNNVHNSIRSDETSTKVSSNGKYTSSPPKYSCHSNLIDKACQKVEKPKCNNDHWGRNNDGWGMPKKKSEGSKVNNNVSGDSPSKSIYLWQ